MVTSADVSSRHVPKKAAAPSQRGWGSIFILLLAVSLVGLGLYLFSPDWLRPAGDLPVSLRSPLRANYAMDPRQFSLAPVKAEILGEVLSDRSGQAPATDPNSQLATFTAALITPVPTITPLTGSTPGLAPQASITAQPTTSLPVPTSTQGESASLTPTLRSSPTIFFTAVPTATLRPYFTATFPVVTVAVTYWSPTSTATRAPTKTEPTATQAATKTLQPTKELPTTTPKATATLSPTSLPSPQPSLTSAYPPPPPPPTAYP